MGISQFLLPMFSKFCSRLTVYNLDGGVLSTLGYSWLVAKYNWLLQCCKKQRFHQYIVNILFSSTINKFSPKQNKIINTWLNTMPCAVYEQMKFRYDLDLKSALQT